MKGKAAFLLAEAIFGGGSSRSTIGSLAAVSRICGVGEEHRRARKRRRPLVLSVKMAAQSREKPHPQQHLRGDPFGGARAATIFVAETIARPGQQALCLGVRHRAFAMRIRRRLVRRVGVTASLGAMFGASNVVLFAVMLGGSAMRLGCRFVKFGCLCIMSLGHNFSSMELLH